VAAAVPVIEAALISRMTRPPVPGPHDQDGTVGDANSSRPVPMIWLGDSLASGVGADTADAAFPRRAAELYCAMHQRSVLLTCLARPGARAADVLAHQVPAALTKLGLGTVAVVTVGSNDVGSFTGPRRFRHDYSLILQTLLATGATVVAVGLPDIAAARVMAQPLRSLVGWIGRRADRNIRRLATAHGAHYLGIDTRPPRGTKTHVFLAADRWHPNSDTYHLWAHRFVALVAPVVRPL
jgi:lysophospholipase L1-like esterase